MFAQMATSEADLFLDAGAVERIKGMLNQLISNIEDSLADYNELIDMMQWFNSG